jgi:hypothetical protein
MPEKPDVRRDTAPVSEVFMSMMAAILQHRAGPRGRRRSDEYMIRAV